MEIGIIGAGFTGLTAALVLSRAGHKVTVLEKESIPGGLAMGFSSPGWEWPLEKHYHHLFASDKFIQKLAIDIHHPIDYVRPVTSTFVADRIEQLDSPLTLLRFSQIPLPDRIRTGVVLAYLKYVATWQQLEKYTAQQFLSRSMGQRAWKTLWEPLFVGKFGPYVKDISAAWFWARIKARTPSLGYPRGGFQALSQSLVDAASKNGTTIHYGVSISSIEKVKGRLQVSSAVGKPLLFDKVICTLPTPFFTRLTRGLPSKYLNTLKPLAGLGAVNLVLSLKHTFLPGGVYWLNINDRSMPFLAVVEHTNFMDPAHYAGEKLLYVGNYLPSTHKYFSMKGDELLQEFLPHLRRINPQFTRSWVKRSWVWTAPFAQPIVTPGYSRHVPPLDTPIPGLYLANMQQVYPWDRGTNFAVELGQKVAQHALKN